MAKHSQQRGPLTQRFERRYGRDELPDAGGVNTEKAPPDIGPHQFVRLVNVRWRDGGIGGRGGQSALWAGGGNGGTPPHPGATGVYPGMFDLGSPCRLWFTGDGCPGQSAGLGFYIGHFDPEQDPTWQRAAWYDAAVSAVNLGAYGGQPYISVDNALRRLTLIQVPYGRENIALAGDGQDVPIETFTGYVVKFLQAFDGKLFIGLDAGAGASKVVSYDGRTIRDDLSSIDPPIAAGLWRDSLIIGFASGTGHIRVRAAGDTPSWTTVTAAGVAVAPGVNSIRSYADVAYLCDGATKVWAYNGSTLTTARTVAGATIRALAVGCNGTSRRLFYGYGTSGSHAVIGMTDGSTWTDAHKDLTAVDCPTATDVRGMEWYRDCLAVAVLSATPKLCLSPRTTTSGTYSVVGYTSSYANAVFYLVAM